MVNKTKKTPEKIKLEILEELNNGPKTILEISENIGSNWLTTEKFIIELIEEKKVHELISASKSKVYCSYEDPAFYCLPFSKKVRKDTLALLHTISKKWREETGDNIPKTKLQKIAVELVEEQKLERIPVLRFHYGQTLALRYEEKSEHYELFSLTKEQNEFLLQLIDQYNKLSTAEIKLRQYKKENMSLYKEKEENLSLSKISDKNNIKNSLLKLSSIYPLELEDSFELFDKMIYCAINILNLKDISAYQQILTDIFALTWDCLTTEYFLHDAEKWILPERKSLFSQIKNNILNSKITNIENILRELQEELDSLSEDAFEGDTNKSKELQHILLADL